jgi:hypothetical protein
MDPAKELVAKAMERAMSRAKAWCFDRRDSHDTSNHYRWQMAHMHQGCSVTAGRR